MSTDPILILREFGSEADTHTRRALDAAGHTAFRSIDELYLHLIDAEHATPGRLALELDVTQQAVSKNIRHLLRHGYLEQLNDQGDRRRRPVAVTNKGRRALAICASARADVWNVNGAGLLDWLAANAPAVAR